MGSNFTPNGVELKGLDTVVAFPQWYLNYNLADILAHGKTTDGKSLQTISLTVGGTVFLTGTVSALKADLFIPNNPQKLIFTISFSAGTFRYWDIETNPPTQQQAAIAGLTFGFQVDMADQPVAMESLPPGVQGQVKAAASNLGKGAFTIQQLLMDFQNAKVDMYDSSKTVWPAKFPTPAQTQLLLYIKTYLLDVANAGGNILGYAVTVDNPGGLPDAIPTFPPTGLMFAVNQYLPNSNPKPEELNPDYDTLNYNMMTGGKVFPRLIPMPWMGNFVVPPGSDQSFGLMSISNELIMQKWLLPALSPLITTYWGLSDTNSSVDPSYTVQSGLLVVDGTGLSFTAPAQSSKSHRTNKVSNDDVNYNMSVQVKVTPNIGLDNPSISITKTTSWDMDYTHWYGVDGHAASTESHIWYSVTLEVTINFVGVSNGQIQVNVVSVSRPQKGTNTVYGEPYGWLITKVSGDVGGWKDVTDTMDGVIADTVSMAVPIALPDQLTTLISQNLPAFVVPGSSQLFLRDIFFNNDGDMMIGLSYK